ncbi:hypothetical protein HFO61_30280 [Rhizobium leguminosarum]|uniref:hypothetical protein n=1 Tax=Rhizobium leguminosarum TaxID=384 RepID=UPI001C964FA2|nr:hypothetical protein [Rhizobium leguminosarum]MBY5551035.1 hypothetical protein [Rhizobium leguminosarum]
MSGNDDKWERMRIERPHMWQRLQETRDGLDRAIEEMRKMREEEGIPMDEREEMARDFLGDRAHDIEIGDDGSVAATIAPLN